MFKMSEENKRIATFTCSMLGVYFCGALTVASLAVLSINGFLAEQELTPIFHWGYPATALFLSGVVAVCCMAMAGGAAYEAGRNGD